jgi:hypothetical protein
MATDVIGLKLAGLDLWLDARGSGIHMVAPACYAQFLATDGLGDGLRLRVCDGRLRDAKGWQSLFHDQETWQLWRDGGGRYVFAPSRHSPPPRQIAVDAGFGHGEVVGEFGTNGSAGRAVYPLQDIDMMLFANWLAETGDLIVHAAGIDDGGAGYAFVGHSAAGKSTLASELASCCPVRVLGEDQVIVRYQEGQFLVYGTPWHTDPARCSPGGVPLKKLFFLDRAGARGVAPCGQREGIERLLPEAFIPYYNRAGVERVLDRLPCLAEQVPFYTLGYDLGSDVINMIRDA